MKWVSNYFCAFPALVPDLFLWREGAGMEGAMTHDLSPASMFNN